MDDEIVLATQNLLRQCIREQCDEVEMLQSIFCNPGEMKIDDHSILTDMFDYLEEKSDRLTKKLDYTITIPISSQGSHTLELQIEFPHTYPSLEQPNITVRTTLNVPNKMQIENEIKRQVYEYIDGDEVDRSTVYVYPIVVWLQDNIDKIISNTTKSSAVQKQSPDQLNVDAPVEMERLWIYSHHLKSTQKRQDIMKLAKELDLSGFSKPGKPGIVCIEGVKACTQEFWKIIRQWAWQRITVRLSEIKSKPQSKCQQFRRFNQFREILYGDDCDNDSVAPITMSEFMKFLENHNCGYVKKELLLLE
ncbi:RWD domain-containing protein 2A-like [Sitodiplosis mosellana]|uniref:RWD domain-containing protein 2A-like n=1 Tax=Sitodiplosis mosellana TaxID=263140 RepID=UPI002444D319|nr:RWD domain-containing protein 2A-like [Sitodiplosis mosellana]